MNPPPEAPPLPHGAILMGLGKTFSIDGFEAGFMGWRWHYGMKEWNEDVYLGSDRETWYAVDHAHPLAIRLHGGVYSQTAERLSARHEVTVTEDQMSEIRKARLLQEFANDPDLRPITPEPVASTQEPEVVAGAIQQADGSWEMINGWKPKDKSGDSDPNGLDQHAPGAKLDNGKTMAGLLLGFGDALEAVGRVASFGAMKYSLDGWKAVADGERRYKDAAMRHALKMEHEYLDPESGMPHAFHLAWNVLAALQLHIRPDSACPTPPQTPSTT